MIGGECVVQATTLRKYPFIPVLNHEQSQLFPTAHVLACVHYTCQHPFHEANGGLLSESLTHVYVCQHTPAGPIGGLLYETLIRPGLLPQPSDEVRPGAAVQDVDPDGPGPSRAAHAVWAPPAGLWCADQVCLVAIQTVCFPWVYSLRQHMLVVLDCAEYLSIGVEYRYRRCIRYQSKSCPCSWCSARVNLLLIIYR